MSARSPTPFDTGPAAAQPAAGALRCRCGAMADMGAHGTGGWTLTGLTWSVRPAGGLNTGFVVRCRGRRGSRFP